MQDIDPSQDHRSVGSMLSGEDVEQLRQSVLWACQNRGLRYREIADECGSPEHTVRNFANEKSMRPDNVFLGRLYKYFTENKHLLPDQFRERDEIAKIRPIDLLRETLPITDADVERTSKRYTGYYICFRNSYKPSKISVSWLHIIKARTIVPRFSHVFRYADPVDGLGYDYVIMGYAFCRKGCLYLIGQHDGGFKNIVLTEPSTRRFKYLYGIGLLTSRDEREPFATRIICQYLGSDASRSEWKDKIGVFSQEEFKTRFVDADKIMASFGETISLSSTD